MNQALYFIKQKESIFMCCIIYPIKYLNYQINQILSFSNLLYNTFTYSFSYEHIFDKIFKAGI